MNFNHESKELIIAPEGYSIFNADESGIEYRFLTHYTQEPSLLKAYTDDPDADFHGKMALLVGIVRKLAKTMNFLSGYGGGVKKFILQLLADMSYREDMLAKLVLDHPGLSAGELAKLLVKAIIREGTEKYEQYHKGFPSLKRTAKKLQQQAWERGFVINLFGRVRSLRRSIPSRKYSPTKDALNTLCQGGAADVMKEAMAYRLCEIRKFGGYSGIFAQIHDAVAGYIPTELARDPRFRRDLAWSLEVQSMTAIKPLSVRLRCKQGSSTVNWAEAADEEESLPIAEVDSGGAFTWR